MREVFADTSHWIALASPKDELHAVAVAWQAYIQRRAIIHTTDEVLTEFLNSFATRHRRLRRQAPRFVREILSNVRVRVHPSTRDRFLGALARYEERADKLYSLVDCASFVLMEQLKIDEALTEDRHFEQEGFRALLRSAPADENDA